MTIEPTRKKPADDDAVAEHKHMHHDHMQHMLLMVLVAVVANLANRGGQERYFGYAVLVLAPLGYVIMKKVQKK